MKLYLRLTSLIILLLFTELPILVADKLWPLSVWTKPIPEDSGLDSAQLEKARDYALTGDSPGYIIRYGRVVMP